MICKKCNKEIEEGSTFCPYCGVKVSENTVTQVDNGVKPVEEKKLFYYVQPRPVIAKKKMLVPVIILSSVLAFISYLIFSINLEKLDNRNIQYAAASREEASIAFAVATIILALAIFVSSGVTILYAALSASKNTAKYKKQLFIFALAVLVTTSLYFVLLLISRIIGESAYSTAILSAVIPLVIMGVAIFLLSKNSFNQDSKE
ncbi:MAG: zinc-ribbon domain-containing protein [Acholeplasmatales bacterium]|nr:zinc-ribbon domain-containing protein [Acholeplasmatales bacterium]